METKKQYAWNVWHMVAMFFMTIALVCCAKLPIVQSFAEEVTVTPTPTVVASPTIEPEEPSKTTIDNKTYYEIDTAAELYWFAGLVNGTLKDAEGNKIDAEKDANAILTDDIDLNKDITMGNVDFTRIINGTLVDDNEVAISTEGWIEWTPISGYSGTFDGQGHIISHLFIDKPDSIDLGFLSWSTEEAVVKNFGIKDSYIRGYMCLGSIIANGTGTIENCFSDATIVSTFATTSSTDERQKYFVGGITSGKLNLDDGASGNQKYSLQNSATVKNSYFAGTIYFNGGAGGEKYAIGPVSINTTGGIQVKIINCFSTNQLKKFGSEEGLTSADYNGFIPITNDQVGEQLVHMLQEGMLNGENYWSQGENDYPIPKKGDVICHIYTGDDSKCYCGKYQLEEKLNDIWKTISVMSAEDIPTKDSNGYYELDSVQDLYWFAGLVNGNKYVCRKYTYKDEEIEIKQNVLANAILTKDIKVNEKVIKEDGKSLVDDTSTLIPWIPMGEDDITYSVLGMAKVLKPLAYMGTFDGNGHTISGLYWPYERSYNGFFGVITAEGDGDPCGTIQNLAIKDSYFISGGGICNSNDGLIRNCYSNVVIGSNGGGLVGTNYSMITRSYYAGTSPYAIYSAKGTIKYCVSNTDLYASSEKLEQVGNFYIEDGVYKGDGISKFNKLLSSESWKENGTFTYILNNERTEEEPIRWYQTIGKDSEPVLAMDDTEHAIVYGGTPTGEADAPFHCWNTPEVSEQGHVYGTSGPEQYYCSYCYAPNVDAVIEVDDTTTTTLIKDSTWQINSKDALIAFGTYMNKYYGDINKIRVYQDAVLLDDIDLNPDMGIKLEDFSKVSIGGTYKKLLYDGKEVDTTGWFEWTPIFVNGTQYSGTFDGQGYEIKHLYTNENEKLSGLFGSCSAIATIRNLGIRDSYIIGEKYCASISALGGQIENCYSNAIVATSSSGTIGGIALGGSYGVELSISNSYFIGKLYNPYGASGMAFPIGQVYYNNNNNKLTKCENTSVGGCYFSENTLMDGTSLQKYACVGSTLIGSEEIENKHLVHRLQYQTNNTLWIQDEAKGYPVPKVLTDDTKIIEHSFNNSVCYCGKDERFDGYFKKPEEKDGVYEIANANQLYWFAGYVNGDMQVCEDGQPHPKASARLIANITVNEGVIEGVSKNSTDSFLPWLPIGMYTDKEYQGTFDGQGYAISGLYSVMEIEEKEYEGQNYNGFFGIVNGGTIKNVAIKDSYFENTNKDSKSDQLGSICSCLIGSSKIQGCYSDAILKNVNQDDCGGICGYSFESTIEQCYYNGKTTEVHEKLKQGIAAYHGNASWYCATTQQISAEPAMFGIVLDDESDKIIWMPNTDAFVSKYKDILPQQFNEESSSKDFKSGGFLTYFLNKCQETGDTVYWYQTLGKDGNEEPVLLHMNETEDPSSIPLRVYAGERCDGTLIFANDPNDFGKHQYQYEGKNMICRYCGQSAFTFAGTTLTLYSDLSVKFLVDKNLFTEMGYKDPYVSFNFVGQSSTVSEYSEQGDYYVFEFKNIAPNQMNETITATLYAYYQDETEPSQSKPLKYSIGQYCYNMLSKYTEDNAKERTLLVDLLNYGAASQNYTEYKATDLVNANLTPDQSAWGTQSAREWKSEYKISQTPEKPSVTWKGANLRLEDAVTIVYMIQADSIDGLTLKVSTSEQNWSIASNKFVKQEGYYCVYFNGLNATQMSEVVNATVYKGDTAVSETLTYSIESYAAAKKDSTDANLVALLKAMMNYGDSARKLKEGE